jgi:uncharacterized membrane protein
MGAEFDRPWLLLLLLPAAAVLIFPWLKKKWDFRLKLNTAIRAAVLTLLILAMSGMSVVFPGGNQALMIAADRSASMNSYTDSEVQMINSIEQKKGKTETGLLTFGGSTSVEYLKGTGHFTGFDTKVDVNLTGIAAALNMSSALLPQDAVRRVLLMTDGLENSGDMLSAARALSAAGIRMDVAYFAPKQAGEAQVTSLAVPGYLHQGESFDIVATVHSTVAGKAVLRLYCDRMQVSEQTVELQKGENRFVFTYKADKDGIHTWKAEISAAWDTFSGNNRADAYTKVVGRPAVLLVSDAAEETEQLGKVLESAGYIVEKKGAVELGGKLDDYMKYQVIVLCNVPATSLSQDAMKMLDTFTRVLGRGLLVTGGQNSFALGEYGGTLLEDMLPVTSKVENYAELPKLALALVIDKSGSMSDGQYGISKRDLAVEAAARSVEILQPNDEIGVIAFDDQAAWAVPMGLAADKKKIQDQIATIRIGGGTMMYTPMVMARDALVKSDAQLKHVILLTDGMPADSGFEALAKDMKANGITLSTVAVGKDADTTLLKNLAELGGGRTYLVDEFSNIVSIFAKETYLATGAYLQNRTFTPAATSLAPAALSNGLPALHGYVNTTPKQMAEVELVSDKKHVIYARRRYGLGRTAVWTSDVKGLWSQDLLGSSSAVKILSSLVSQVMPEDEGNGALEAALENGQGVVSLQSATTDGAKVKATVIAPDNSSFDITLDPVRPGQYEAKFDASQPGTYIIRATQQQSGAPDVTMETGLSSSWSKEYDLRYDDPKPKLEEAAKMTGGKLVSSAEELLSQNMEMKKGRADLVGPLVLAALFLFLLDIAIRRMRWDARILSWLAASKQKQRAKASTVAVSQSVNREVPVKASTTQPQAEVQAASEPVKKEIPAKQPTGTPANSAAQALLEKRKQQKK